MTKVDIISGFLGAGKTTLIKKLIKEVFAGEQIVLIENEFGEIGIDGGFLKEAGINITEMNSGCICCSLVGDFGEALKKVVTQYHPDRVIIEPSGVGKLSDVETAVRNVAKEVGLEIATASTVVDAKKAKIYMKNFGEFFNDQVETARIVILSRTGGMDEAKLEEVVNMLKEKNPSAAVVTTDWNEIGGDVIFKAMSESDELEKITREAMDKEHSCHEHHHEYDKKHSCHEHHHEHDKECDCHEHHHEHDKECNCHEHHYDENGNCSCGHHHEHHHHHADEVFTSFGMETPKKFSEAVLSDILGILSKDETYGQVLRAKGIVESDSCWLHFDLTPGEFEIRKGSPDYTGRICVIGTKLDEDGLKKLFGV